MSRKKNFDIVESLEKAMNLFWEKGYHATSIQELVDSLGINRASIYDTYGSKYGLFQKALAHYQEIQAKRMADFLYLQLNVREGLYYLFEAEVDLALANLKGCFLVNSIAELANSDLELNKQLTAHKNDFERVFFNYLQYGLNQGQLSPYKDINTTSSYLFLMYSGLKTNSKIQDSKEALMKAVTSALSVLD